MPTIDHAELLDAFARVAPRLTCDQLFRGAGTVERMLQLLQGQPRDMQQLFGETLRHCDVRYRYAGLLLAEELVRYYCVHERFCAGEGAMELCDGEPRVFTGDLCVDGDLLLYPQATVVVTGDLDVRGNVVAGPHDYNMLAVAGRLRAENVMSNGELVVGRELQVADVAYLHGADCPALTPLLRARVLVQNDRVDLLGAVNAGIHICEPLGGADSERLRQVAALVGVPLPPDAERLEAALRRRLTRNV